MSFRISFQSCIGSSIYIPPTSKSSHVGRHVLQRASTIKPYKTIRFNPSPKHTMGWFGFGSSSPSSSPSPSSSSSSSSSGEGIAPNRLQRARCWEARDGFFQCLDRNDILDPIKESSAAHASCSIQEVAFEKECVGSWVCARFAWFGKPECPLIGDRSSTLKSEESWNAIARQCSRSSKQKVQSLSKCRILSDRLRRNPKWFVPRWRGAYKKGRRGTSE